MLFGKRMTPIIRASETLNAYWNHDNKKIILKLETKINSRSVWVNVIFSDATAKMYSLIANLHAYLPYDQCDINFCSNNIIFYATQTWRESKYILHCNAYLCVVWHSAILMTCFRQKFRELWHGLLGLSRGVYHALTSSFGEHGYQSHQYRTTFMNCSGIGLNETIK